MKILIRKAVKEDCPQIMKLIEELAVYEKAAHEVSVSFDHFVESGFEPHPVWWAFVAVQKDINNKEQIVGFALYYIRYSTWKGQRMYLEDLLVTKNMRGHGIGKLLFNALMEECKQKNLTGIAWQVLDWNEPAINFYKKLEGVQFDHEWINCSLNCYN